MAEVDTKASPRRKLRFETIDDALAEVERVAAADREGRLRCAGNWSAGQMLGHIAAWAEYSYKGYPLKVPWFVRLIVRFQKGKLLREGLKPGLRIPKVEGGTYGTEPMSTERGAARLRQVFERLRSEPAIHPSPVFGKLSHAELVALNLRHAELHLGFVSY